MRIVLGVAGSIAAYKACDVASRLTQAGHSVHVVMTPTARQFVAPLTFSTLTQNPVAIGVDDEPLGPLSHVRLAHEADLMLIVPITADLIAKMATGRVDDMLTAIYLGRKCPVFAAPAMEAEMWEHPATVRNVRQLEADGVRFLGPVTGRLASGFAGSGRMVEPGQIVETVRRLTVVPDLEGLRVMITAGPTWEFFDPVRMLTNPSTGIMGAALAAEARDRGARVTFVHGPLRVPPPDGVDLRPVISALDMQAVVEQEFSGQDVVVAAAAVVDFRPAQMLSEKMKKQDAIRMEWPMIPNPDILAALGRRKSSQILVGFAAETSDHLARGRKKLEDKSLDLVVANRVEGGRGFGSCRSETWLIWPDGQAEPVVGDKPVVARAIWDAIRRIREGRAHG